MIEARTMTGLIGLAALGLAGCSQDMADDTASQDGLEVTASAEDASVNNAPAQVESALADSLEELVAGKQLPGAIAIISRDGETLAHARTGYLNYEEEMPLPEDAIFRLYSMSKPITSVAIMMLVERGALELDDPVSDYLPALADMRVYESGTVDDMTTVPAERPITIHDLLTHTSGIPYHFTGDTPVHQYYRKHGVMRDTPVGRTPEDGPPAGSLSELVERIGEAPLLYQPGEKFEYSYSTTVLGAVIEAVSGQRLDVFLEENLFRPLDMTDTGFFISDADLPRFVVNYRATPDGFEAIEMPETSDYRDTERLLDGGGALAGTAADYLHFAEMLANGGVYEGERILTEDSLNQMFRPQAEIAGFGPSPVKFGYGFSLGDATTEAAGMQPAGTVSWSGSGNTYFLVDPQTEMVGLLMTHILVSGEQQSRTGTFRALINEAIQDLSE